MEKEGQEKRHNKPAASFQNLLVWQKAHHLVLNTYTLSQSFPREEIYGLTSQLRRAVVSIAANIAGGFKKFGRADKARFMNISQGSRVEVKCYFILDKDLNTAIPTKS